MGKYGLKASAGRELVIVSLVLQAISITATILRVVSRRIRKISLGLDDYLMLAAIWFVIPSTILVITTVTHGGVGLHIGEVDPGDLIYTMKMIIVLQSFYGVGLSLVKTSLMVLYYRLFGTKRSFRIAIFITGAIVWGWGFSIVLESFLLCKPIEFNYNPFLPGGTCGNRNAAFVVAGVLNMVTDFMVMSLPVPYIWKLQLPLGRKLGLVATFSLGLFVSAISMVRVFSLISIDFADATYTLPEPLMWSIVEEQLAVVAANLPILRHVFATILPQSWLGSSRRKATGSTGAYVGSGQQQKFGLTRMDGGVNKSVVSSTKVRQVQSKVASNWSDDGRSETNLAVSGAPPDGIQISRDFRVT
ncbi:hypothetical protein BJX63DRAFT_423398 [Aspergillus granulosus]|uniref:Rhodopsin domain-containing protein n=1 Tax=Aspergillus granulosus TaxID=176169 RepID=A0ABR4H3L6_9EURO